MVVRPMAEVDNVLFESHNYTRFNGSWREENQAYPLELLLPQFTSRGKKNLGKKFSPLRCTRPGGGPGYIILP
jgi:hypothetical protein